MARRSERSELRDEGFDAFELACPLVRGNPFVVHFPHPKQAEFLGAHVWPRPADPMEPFECLYGGAAGGGKSDAILMAAAQYAWKHGHFSGLILRRSLAELAKPGALMDRAIRWWVPLGVHWNADTRAFTFPNGARVVMGYHAGPRDDAQYQGNEYHFVAFDELTHWPDDRAYEWLRTRLRKGRDDPVPLRQLSTSNPGNAGHNWVKRRFIGDVDPATGRWSPPLKLYIPATIDDNPSLDREAYKRSLEQIHPTRRAQLLAGDWSARDPGDYFRVEWFGPLLDPELDPLPRGEHVMVRWWDLAASENRDAARTAGVLMARLRLGVRVVVHASAFRATPGARDARIVQQAHADGRTVTVGVEIEGGSGGPAQFESLAVRLRAEGFRVVGARPQPNQELTDREKLRVVRAPTENGKKARADPVASCLERGYQRRGECRDDGSPWWSVDAGRNWWEHGDGLRVYAGPWTQEYLDELEGFPGGALKDMVDATSAAWAWLEAHPFGAGPPVAPVDRRAAAQQQDQHPADRLEDEKVGNPAAPRWRP